jgi:hypothetical protein
VPLDGNPTDLNDLITKKYQGILSIYPGFTNILFDEQIDYVDWNPAASAGALFGERQTTALCGEVSSIMESTAHTLASTPEICMVRYEVFRILETDPVTGQATRAYQDVTTSDADYKISVAFDGSGFTDVTSGVLLNIPLGVRGNQFKVRFRRTASGPKTYLGSWAVAY